jgi:hypothetical protein
VALSTPSVPAPGAGIPATPPAPQVLKNSTPAPGTAPRRAGGPAGLSADAFPLAILLGIPLAITVWGLPYYAGSLATRVRSPLHALLRPSGTIGLALGIAAFSLFLFLWLYPLRKKFRSLAWAGPVAGWLRLHSLAGLSIPLLAAVHAGWRFDGLIGLGYLAMLLVALSGVVGRYLYTHIPRSRNGVELNREEAANERRALLTEIAAATGRDPRRIEQALSVDARAYEGLNPLHTLLRMAADDVDRRRVLRTLRAEWRRPAADVPPLDPRALARALRLARREITLTQQVRMLEASRRVFGLWHVAHRPFAITALLAVLVHVIVAIVVGGVGRM